MHSPALSSLPSSSSLLSFTGSIPATICTLNNSLRQLQMRGFGSACGSWIGGSLPNCLKDMQSLEVVLLSGNGLFGTIPFTAVYPNMITLDLSVNKFSGEIPDAISDSSINSLDISNNRINGPLKFPNCKSDCSVSASVNRLTGVFPAVNWKLYNLVDVMDGQNLYITYFY